MVIPCTCKLDHLRLEVMRVSCGISRYTLIPFTRLALISLRLRPCWEAFVAPLQKITVGMIIAIENCKTHTNCGKFSWVMAHVGFFLEPNQKYLSSTEDGSFRRKMNEKGAGIHLLPGFNCSVWLLLSSDKLPPKFISVCGMWLSKNFG